MGDEVSSTQPNNPLSPGSSTVGSRAFSFGLIIIGLFIILQALLYLIPDLLLLGLSPLSAAGSEATSLFVTGSIIGIIYSILSFITAVQIFRRSSNTSFWLKVLVAFQPLFFVNYIIYSTNFIGVLGMSFQEETPGIIILSLSSLTILSATVYFSTLKSMAKRLAVILALITVATFVSANYLANSTLGANLGLGYDKAKYESDSERTYRLYNYYIALNSYFEKYGYYPGSSESGDSTLTSMGIFNSNGPLKEFNPNLYSDPSNNQIDCKLSKHSPLQVCAFKYISNSTENKATKYILWAILEDPDFFPTAEKSGIFLYAPLSASAHHLVNEPSYSDIEVLNR